MPVRRRPRVTLCEQQLLYGVVSVEDEGGEGSRVRPLTGARVSIVATGQPVGSTTTRRDGSYSVVVGSCRECERANEHIELRVVKEEPCVRFNATRAVHVGCDGRSLRRQDVTLYENDAMGMCAVTTASRESHSISQYESYRAVAKEGDVTRHASAITTIVALLWGFFMLWSIARWGSAGHRRQRRHYRADEIGDLDSKDFMELSDYPFPLLNKDSRRRDEDMKAAVGSLTHPIRPAVRSPMNVSNDSNLQAFRFRLREGRVIVDENTDDE